MLITYNNLRIYCNVYGLLKANYLSHPRGGKISWGRDGGRRWSEGSLIIFIGCYFPLWSPHFKVGKGFPVGDRITSLLSEREPIKSLREKGKHNL